MSSVERIPDGENDVASDVLAAARERVEDNRCSAGLRQVDVSTYVRGLFRLVGYGEAQAAVMAGRVLERLERAK